MSARKGTSMDVRALTAPCGLDCFNCPCYLANDHVEIRKQVMSSAQVSSEDAACRGCRKENGIAPIRRAYGHGPCRVYRCASEKSMETCADCPDFPCDNLQPYADRASVLPHNIKVFNLALIRKMGLEKWAREKAKQVRDTYFGHKFDI